MSGVRGDYSKLRELIQGVGKLSRTGRRDVVKVFSAAFMRRTDLCFQRSSTPYGEAWPPLKVRKGMPLLDTGRLRNSVVAGTRPRADGVYVSSNVVYAAIHNYGGSVSHSARVQPRNARGNRFASRKEAGKTKASHKRLGVAKTRVSFIGAHDVGIPKRQFLPDPSRDLPWSYAKDLQDSAKAVIEATLRGAL